MHRDMTSKTLIEKDVDMSYVIGQPDLQDDPGHPGDQLAEGRPEIVPAYCQ
jgi:hypothetical protein